MSRLRIPELIPDYFDDLPAEEREALDLAGRDAVRRQRQAGGRPDVAILHVEEFRCCRCNHEIHKELRCAFLTAERGGLVDVPQRIVRGYCIDCDFLYEVTTELVGGIWQKASTATIVSDVKIRRQFFARVRTMLRGARNA